MFFRTKKASGHTYLQLVENRRGDDGRVRQRVIASLGRYDEALDKGTLDALLASGSRLSEKIMILSEHSRGKTQVVETQRVGPSMIFDRLWQETGCADAIKSLLQKRKFEFPVERAIFAEVLHRIMSPGSDRAGAYWRKAYGIKGVEDVRLHHSYRAMAWLGEAIEPGVLAPRCSKDQIEEELFRRRRDLFSSLELVFFDTTSVYFEGQGGADLGARGYSKDKRPDLKQMVVGVVIDEEGWPICCEMWPGNTADAKTVIPVIQRLEKRFGISRVCFVADRGMIGKKTIAALERKGISYILGARMRSVKEIREDVLQDPKRYQVVIPRRRGKAKHKTPSPLKVKEVKVEDRRYIVCFNEAQAEKDARDREAIVAHLEKKMKQGPKALVGNKGYRKFVAISGKSVSIDEQKIEDEARFDGLWVLRTNTDYEPADVALAYKNLWMVEDVFRTMKSLFDTRPIYHRTDEAIRGHVFCSFLALLLRAELENRLAAKGHTDIEWSRLLLDLDRLELADIEQGGKRFRLRNETSGDVGKVFQAAGVALPPTMKQLA